MSNPSNDPWAWLGLLKWTLAYTDGTAPSDESMAPISEEDRAFLEEVMKEGIIDENERMKTILKEVSEKFEEWKTTDPTQEQQEQVDELLEELRDIVEQIDYARAFCSMKGLVFLMGCIGERERLPTSTRLLALGLVATLAQNNPPVQKELLEMGALGSLSKLYFEEDADAFDIDGKLRARILQAISATVRSNELAEAVYCRLDQAVELVERGLGVGAAAPLPAALVKRALFFLSALVTSDATTRERIRMFGSCIAWLADTQLDNEVQQPSAEVREMVLAMLERILEQKKSVSVVLDRKDALAAMGVRRVAALRNLTEDEADFGAVELEHWEKLLQLLARAEPDAEEEAAAAPLMIDADKSTPAQ